MAIQSTNPPSIFTLDQWKGLNQQAKRATIDDQELYWDENLFPVGTGNLRSCWSHGDHIYIAPAGTEILRIFCGFIGFPTPQFAAPGPQYGGRFCWCFLSDGNVDQVDLDTHAITRIGQVWEPVAPQYWASAKVWRPRFFGSVAGQNGGVLIGSPQGLYGWDGQNLSSPGDDAPDWLTDIAETDPSGPVPPMPEGLPGIYCMEVFQDRLFVAGKDVISFSAPSNGADFSDTDGGGSVGYFGDRLTYSYMDMAASANYLYVFGDSSTDLISGIQLTGQGSISDPFVTNFNYGNIDPMVGHGFPRPVGRVGREFVQLTGVVDPGTPSTQRTNIHSAGIWRTTGAVARPVGQKVTRIYETLDTSSFLPTMAPATMFGFRTLLVNGRFRDPWGVTRSLLLMLHRGEADDPQWSVASQGLELTNITSYEQDSIVMPYGTDGQRLYPLFARPDPTLVKRLSSKFIAGDQPINKVTIKNFKRLYMEVSDESGQGVGFTGTLTCRGGGVPGGVQDIGFQLPPGKDYDILPSQPAPTGGGIQAAIDLQSVSPDFTIERIHVGSEERTMYGA